MPPPPHSGAGFPCSSAEEQQGRNDGFVSEHDPNTFHLYITLTNLFLRSELTTSYVQRRARYVLAQ